MYLKDVAVKDIINVIHKHGLVLHEKNSPKNVSVSDDLTIKQKYFSDFYRKKDGNYEIQIGIMGLNDNLGMITVDVRNFKHDADKEKMKKYFNNIMRDIPIALFTKNIKGPDFFKSFSENLDKASVNGLFRKQINGIDYIFTSFDTEITVQIAKEGN